MNSTKTLAIVAVLTAAALVVGVTSAAKAAFAQGDGNTATAQINSQRGSQSGFDNDFEQSASNVICTHPGEKEALTPPTPPPKQPVGALCLHEED